MHDTQKPLTAKQEMLLGRYFDGQCSWLEKLRSKQLLKNNAEAKRYTQSMFELSDGYRQVKTESDLSADLWDKIERRIDQEEHASIFLGPRRFPGRAESFFDLIRASTLIPIGAAVTALAVFFVVSPYRLGTVNSAPARGSTELAMSRIDQESIDQEAVASRRRIDLDLSKNAPTINLASVGGSENSAIPLSSDLFSQPIELDWMRSRGRVVVLSDPESNAPIIWVQKRRPSDESASFGRGEPVRKKRRGVIVLNEDQASKLIPSER